MVRITLPGLLLGLAGLAHALQIEVPWESADKGPAVTSHMDCSVKYEPAVLIPWIYKMRDDPQAREALQKSSLSNQNPSPQHPGWGQVIFPPASGIHSNGACYVDSQGFPQLVQDIKNDALAREGPDQSQKTPAQVNSRDLAELQPSRIHDRALIQARKIGKLCAVMIIIAIASIVFHLFGVILIFFCALRH